MPKDLFILELKKLNIECTEDILNKLDTYYHLLVEWNKVMNLTAITKEEDVYLKHFYDSLTITSVIDLNTITSLCDVGTGAGFPGLVLKIFYPHIHLTLVDSLNKRITFLNEVIKVLDLKEVVTIHSRAEDYAKVHREKYDLVTARAVASLPILLEYCIPLAKVNGYFIPLKGSIDEENDSLKAISILDIKLEEKKELVLPIEFSKRILYKFKKLKVTNKLYPRKPVDIEKKPLK